MRLFLGGAFEDGLVGFGRHAVVTYMSRVVPGLPQTFCHRRRESIVDQKPQGCRHQGDFALTNRFGGVAQGLADVVAGKVGIGF